MGSLRRCMGFVAAVSSPGSSTSAELSLYDDLVAGAHGDRVRLEQERIRCGVATRALEAAVGNRV